MTKARKYEVLCNALIWDIILKNFENKIVTFVELVLCMKSSDRISKATFEISVL